MIREIPVYSKVTNRLCVVGNNAYLKDKDGMITWSYSGKDPGRICIVGAPRSATVYMTKLLCKLGYEIGHEQSGPDGSVGYHLAAIRPDNCFHQVRHPLKQIASMMGHRNWGFCDQIIDVPDLKLLGCMTMWLKFNELCEGVCVWRYCIEDLPWDEFLRRIGHKQCKLPDIPKDINADKRTKSLDWCSLFDCNAELANRIYDKSKEYGYDNLDNRKQWCRKDHDGATDPDQRVCVA